MLVKTKEDIGEFLGNSRIDDMPIRKVTEDDLIGVSPHLYEVVDHPGDVPVVDDIKLTLEIGEAKITMKTNREQVNELKEKFNINALNQLLIVAIQEINRSGEVEPLEV